MGILDKKSRVLDAVLTAEGRRQMAVGTFEVSYVTFTDSGVSYQSDTSEGHVDPTDRIYLEACNLPQDQITFEANDEGNLVPFRKQLPMTTPDANIPFGTADSSMQDGRITVYSYNHGRRIFANIPDPGLLIGSSVNDRSGFVYTDNLGNVAKVLLTSSFGRDKNGKVIVSSSNIPPTAYIGTYDGFNSVEFATAVSESIALMKSLPIGPSVECYTRNASVYLDFDTTYVSTKLYQTGALNFPLVLETSRRGGRLLTDVVEGSLFSSQIKGILTSSLDNFIELQTIGSIDRMMEDQEFELSSNELKFDMKNLSKKFLGSAPSVNSIDSLFSDDKLSHLENFMYLPPIIEVSDALVPDKTNIQNLTPFLLGNYPSWGDNEKKLTFSKLSESIKSFGDEKPPIIFTKTSLLNNVIGQFFEVTSKGVTKLDVVDFGPINNDVKEPTAVTDHVFFVGKIYVDEKGTTCFVNMFTLVFSKLPDETGVAL